VPILLFAQTARVDVEALVGTARTHGRVELAATAASPTELSLLLRLEDRVASFRARVRPATAEDHARAVAAARRGRAGGMDVLARRCPTVWELEVVDASPRETWLLCAALASALLGPILPPDDATLVGVKGARLMAQKAAEAETAAR